MLFGTRSHLLFYKLVLCLSHASLHYLLDLGKILLFATVGLYDILKIHVCINMSVTVGEYQQLDLPCDVRGSHPIINMALNKLFAQMTYRSKVIFQGRIGCQNKVRNNTYNVTGLLSI